LPLLVPLPQQLAKESGLVALLLKRLQPRAEPQRDEWSVDETGARCASERSRPP
jgi:hypothetical protein